MLRRFENMGDYQPPYPANEFNTHPHNKAVAAEHASEPRSHKVLKGIGIVALYGALSAVNTLSADVTQGIQEGKERVAHDRPSVHLVYSYPDTTDVFSRHATVVLTGLGTKDASETAASLEAHREVGSVYAIEYSNHNLDTRDIAQGIVEQAHSDGVTHISFDGYSMGGPIALDIATQFTAQDNAPDVVSVVLNSSPIGENALTERSAQGVDIMENILSLHRDLVYYDKGRVAIELMARNEHYLHEVDSSNAGYLQVHGIDSYSFRGRRFEIDYASLRHELSEIKHKMSQPDIAQANLIHNQANVLKSDVREKLEQLDGETLVVYTRSASEHSDTVVDVTTSERNVAEMLSESQQPFKVLREHIQHANPVERRDEYDRMIRAGIQPEIIETLQAQGAPEDTTTATSRATSMYDDTATNEPTA